MPINADYKYLAAEKEFLKAKTNDDKLKALQNMLSTSPTHKGAQSLRSEIKARIARLKATMLRERAVRKTSGVSVSVKKEGAAQIIAAELTGEFRVKYKIEEDPNPNEAYLKQIEELFDKI